MARSKWDKCQYCGRPKASCTRVGCTNTDIDEARHVLRYVLSQLPHITTGNLPHEVGSLEGYISGYFAIVKARAQKKRNQKAREAHDGR